MRIKREDKRKREENNDYFNDHRKMNINTHVQETTIEHLSMIKEQSAQKTGNTEKQGIWSIQTANKQRRIIDKAHKTNRLLDCAKNRTWTPCSINRNIKRYWNRGWTISTILWRFRIRNDGRIRRWTRLRRSRWSGCRTLNFCRWSITPEFDSTLFQTKSITNRNRRIMFCMERVLFSLTWLNQNMQ